ncbi:hypothetical protein M9979_03005 [Sphingomonas sp. RP10(2022)]|uniref:Uncharacterized protein n=1 Tax=Sphingomonas liriopis TaxID=2949094 RepID=A0A9X2HMF8_9SPHN|nr:hypothetical protein [Sphingomonas liriopis]MCP3733846.1 hypothetical protein [Sphingomonas liriopis]
MRFIVDLYRWLILLALAVMLVMASWLGASLMFGPLSTIPFRDAYLGALAGGAVVVILMLGITATFISMHDRLSDVADALDRLTPATDRASL